MISLATGGIGIGGNAYGGQGGHGGDAAVKVELILPDGSTMPYFGGFSYGQTPSGGTTGNTMVLIVGVIMGLLAIFLLVKR